MGGGICLPSPDPLGCPRGLIRVPFSSPYLEHSTGFPSASHQGSLVFGERVPQRAGTSEDCAEPKNTLEHLVKDPASSPERSTDTHTSYAPVRPPPGPQLEQ